MYGPPAEQTARLHEWVPFRSRVSIDSDLPKGYIMIAPIWKDVR